MSNYGFGEMEEPAEQGQGEQGPKWFRDQMAKVSGDIKALRDENASLRADRDRQAVQNTLTAQGYAPEAANLYTGTPDKLNDWLAANAAALARTGGTAAEGEQGVTQQGPPETVVSSESQAALAAMNAAATGGTGPLSGEDQLAARLDAAATPEEFSAIMREAGNVRYR